MVMYYIFLSACLLVLVSGNSEPCTSYFSFTNPHRSALYTSAADEPNICDNDINESVWYRFEVLFPSRIHDKCVAELKCGTEQPIWMNDTHPTAENPGPKSVRVCSPFGEDCCGGWKSMILVKYCRKTGEEDYYVYRLKQVPECDMGYCAGNIVVCPTPKQYNPTSESCTDPHPAINAPVFEGPIVEKKILRKSDKKYDDFYFVCAVSWTDPDQGRIKKGEQFEVIFTFDGREVESVPPKLTDSSNLRVKLWSKEIIGHVGKTVGCKVRAYWKKLERHMSQYLVAQHSYFVGIRYSLTGEEGTFTNPRIEVNEKSSGLTLFFKATVPISCPEIEKETFCKLSIKLKDMSDKHGVGFSSCFMVFSALEEANKPRTQKIKAVATAGMRERTSVIRFLAIKTQPAFFWNNYTMPEISIFITDSSTTALCSSTGDPHITTFDKRYYHVYLEGDFILLKSTSERHFEVHVRHHKCWHVSCNCAVAVREGNNVLGVNACQGPNYTPTPIKYLTDKNVPGATITNNGNAYTIAMPSGAYVRMEWHGIHSSIHVYINSEDFGKTVGLCGTYNGNPGDDTVHRITHVTETIDVPVSFSESYRLKQEESFINGHVFPIKCLDIKEALPNICRCEGKRIVTCSAPDAQTKAFATKFTNHCEKPPVVEPKPKRRRETDETRTVDEESEDVSVDEIEEDIILTSEDLPLQTFDDQYGRNVSLRWPTASGINENDAKISCRTKIETSLVYDTCKNQIDQVMQQLITSCVLDIQLSDDVKSSVASVLDDFQRVCVQKIEASVVKNESIPSPPTDIEKLLTNVVSKICPGQCNEHGTCQNATCICNEGFAADDCSVDSKKPPRLTSIRKQSVCDFRTSGCFHTAIFASNFYNSDKLVCGFILVGQTGTVSVVASSISGMEVSCMIPSSHNVTVREFNIAASPFYNWNVSLSNDNGNHYSNSLRMTVYDSKCQECSSEGVCSQKVETCVIGGKCYLTGEASEKDHCLKCNPKKKKVPTATLR